MRSRFAILAMLVLGFGLSTTGAGLAVSGFADDRADVAQYEEDRPGNEVLPETDAAPDEFEAAPTTTEVQPTRQVESGLQSGGDQLPFTGFAAIPVLLIGLALLSAGLIGRRSSRGS